MDFIQAITNELNVRSSQVSAAVELLDSGNTVPFIARYRKEATGSLDEEQIRGVKDLLAKLRSLDERRQTVLKTIEEQGKLTPDLQAQIQNAATLTALEDLYQPYRPKRHTRASIARDKGLQGLAELILKQVRIRQTLSQIAAPYLNEQVPTEEEAWAGARDIAAEAISDHADIRRQTREKAKNWAILRSEKIASGEKNQKLDERGVYQSYYKFECPLSRVKAYQVLALNRGETEKVLRIRLDIAERDWKNAIWSSFRPDRISPLANQLELAISDTAERLLLPAIERDIRRSLTEAAEVHAINVFSSNLRALLNQPPIGGHIVLGIDPGIRTGCKVAIVDSTGKLLDTGTIYPHEPQKEWEKSLTLLADLVYKYHVSLVAIGNGTASRETEQLISDLIHRYAPGLRYVIVSEAGASVYSASPLAKSELPDLDVSLRGAVSIARRIQDPLAELVKIDPQSIGVGLYQHDVNQKELAHSLAAVVESVVNQVGVDLNTASPALLTYVAGVGPKLASKIVEFRDEKGSFRSRKSLLQVSGMGPKAFEQSAGFLRIRDGDNPLDASAIHPESYPIAEVILKQAGISLQSSILVRQRAIDQLISQEPVEKLATNLGTGIPTLTDILEQIVRPGRDPRTDTPIPVLRSDVLKIEDLAQGMILKGTVRNVVDFGAFIDLGVKTDGLLHRSQLPAGTNLQVGNIIEVEILKIEIERGRIALGWAGPQGSS